MLETESAPKPGKNAKATCRAGLCRLIDRSIINFAAYRMRRHTLRNPRLTEAEGLLHRPDFFHEAVNPAVVEWLDHETFEFHSAVATASRENNRARGVFFRCAENWQSKPAVILLHGWNDILTYKYRFPRWARQFNERGINVAVLTLPYHFERRPTEHGRGRNIISSDLLHTVEAARQGVADIRALAGWLAQSGCPRVGLWGISMGAWLGGLAGCVDRRVDFMVLMTPVVRMDRLIQELAFLAPIRQSLKSQVLSLSKLDLLAHNPCPAPRDVLLLESEYDVFVPAETIEELYRKWNSPEIWRLPHGHISVFSSRKTLRRAMDWVAQKAAAR